MSLPYKLTTTDVQLNELIQFWPNAEPVIKEFRERVAHGEAPEAVSRAILQKTIGLLQAKLDRL